MLASPQTAAAAAPDWVVTMFSDAHDYVGQGTATELDRSNGSVTGTATSTQITLDLSGGTTGGYWTFDIAPPAGSTFRTGYYANAQRTPFRSAGHPGLDLYGNGRGCNTVTGAFEVRTLAYNNGAISRLDLLYEQHCEGGTSAFFGELRLNDPQTASVVVSSSSITWPYFPLGAIGTTVPLYIRNLSASPVTVGTLSIGGADASMFSLVNDQCSGQVLLPGGSCLAFIGFKPTARGPRHALLSVPIGSTVSNIGLDGLIRPGDTYLTMHSDQGDFVGQGLDYSFTPANADIGASASASGFHMSLSASDGEWWDVDMVPGSGQVLAPGNYPNATRYPFNGPGNGLSVTGDGRGCNTLTGSFNVDQVVFSAVDGSVLNFHATFTQHCEGATPALHGTVGWNAEPVTNAPPRVSNLSATTSGSDEVISWTNPAYAPYSYTVIRVQDPAPLDPRPISGWGVYEGNGTSTRVTGLAPGDMRTVTAFTVDSTGNVSTPQSVTFTHGQAPPPPPPSTPCTSAALSPSVASPQAPGATVTFSASATGCSKPEFEFFVQPPGGSWTARTGFGGATWSWNTSGLADGVYGVGVWARQTGSTAAYEAYWLGTFTLSVLTCTAATISTSSSSPQAPGASITFTAAATRCPGAQFRFWLQPKGGSWTMQQDYGAGTWPWNTGGLAPGTYEVGVWARQPGSSNSYDAYALTTFVLGSATCSSAGLTPSAAPPQAPGTTVALNATSNGCAGAQYEFWLLPPGGSWIVKQAYSVSTSWSWNTAGYPLGTYQVGVWVKGAASPNSYDAYFIGAYQLDVGQCTAAGISASPASPQPAGTSITFTATSTGCSAPDYEFWMLSPSDTSWQLVEPYGNGSKFVWNPTGASGPYRVGVWARQAGSPASYDTYAILTFWVGG